MTAIRTRRSRLKSIIGPRLTVLARCVLRGLPLPRWGNMRRVEPFSTAYGFDRGTPVDRYYLDRFLDANRALITGRVLEIQVPSYTRRFGGDVSESHTVDINPAFRATYTCDLADAPQIPTGYYDCFLAPNTFQHILDLHTALRDNAPSRQARRHPARVGGVPVAAHSGRRRLLAPLARRMALRARGGVAGL